MTPDDTPYKQLQRALEKQLKRRVLATSRQASDYHKHFAESLITAANRDAARK